MVVVVAVTVFNFLCLLFTSPKKKYSRQFNAYFNAWDEFRLKKSGGTKSQQKRRRQERKKKKGKKCRKYLQYRSENMPHFSALLKPPLPPPSSLIRIAHMKSEKVTTTNAKTTRHDFLIQMYARCPHFSCAKWNPKCVLMKKKKKKFVTLSVPCLYVCL